MGHAEMLIGRTIAGRYHLLSVLGRGGMATVYKAHQPALERYVAVKVIAPTLTEDPVFIERFRREARTAARLRHANILTIYDFGLDTEDDAEADEHGGGILYLVTELIEGGTLREHLSGPLPFEQAFAIAEQVGVALDYAHRHGIVHRDVKPANILVSAPEAPSTASPAADWSDRRIVLADFGIAKAVTETTQAELTQSSVGVGTAEYMAPEQALGQTVDGRADLYSLGIVLYEMLTGRPPFRLEGAHDTPVALALRQIGTPPPAPAAFNPAIPPALEAVLLRAITKAPTGRYSTGAALVVAAREASQEAGLPLAPPGAAPRLSEQPTTALRLNEPFQIARNNRAAVTVPAAPLPLPPVNAARPYPPHAHPAGMTGPRQAPRWLFAVVPLLLVLLVGLGALLIFLGRPLFGDTANGTPTPPAAREATTTAGTQAGVLPAPSVTPTLTATATPTVAPSPTLTPTVAPSPTVAPTRPPVTASAPQRNARLRATAESALDALPGTGTGAFVADDLVVLRDADRVLPAASVIKLFIAGEAYHQVAAGQLRLDERLTVRQEDVVGGTGVLQNRVGSTYTLDEVIEIMLLYSDNTAGNMLIDRLGGFAPVNQFASSLGLRNTALNRKFLDTAAQNRGMENTTTARDVTTFLLRVALGQVVDPASSDRILAILQRRGQIDRNWQLLNLPGDASAAHITGTLSGLRLDAAIVGTPSGPYIFVTFVQHDDTAAAERAIASAAADVYRAALGQ